MERSNPSSTLIALSSTLPAVLPADTVVVAEASDMNVGKMSRLESGAMLTVAGLMTPGHQAMAGTRTPPSHAVPFPHLNGPVDPACSKRWGHAAPAPCTDSKLLRRVLDSQQESNDGWDLEMLEIQRIAPLSLVQNTRVLPEISDPLGRSMSVTLASAASISSRASP